MSATRVLIVSHDMVGERMAGPGIRYWELARVLADHCAVTLAVPGQTTLHAEGFDLRTYPPSDWATILAMARHADVVMPGGFVLHHAPQLASLDCAIVIDGYDPYPAEVLSLTRRAGDEERAGYERYLLEQVRTDCTLGDFYLCASERQRYWWLGLLAAHGRLNARTYGADPSLRSLVDVVPYGCPPEAMYHERRVLKGAAPGIGPQDRVLLWGGGIWDWLDPLTLLRAVALLVSGHPELRLVFPGTRHPSSDVPDMPMRRRAMDLAAELGLLDRHVFFGDWVPYADWPNYLLEADAGVSLHFDSLETQLAFRTRILDYVRAELPMIVTRGDALAEMVASYGLGVVVDYEDVDGVALGISALLDEPREARHEQFMAAQAALRWERVAEPLIRFCRSPQRAADRPAGWPGTTPADPSCLAEQVERQATEIEQLRALVRGYEQGKLIRFMHKVRRWRSKVSP
ncbi:MAG: glycosyltransferase family 4 protein [Anaerolineae bacterium]|jgi:glycosyltransferase involved in cell wall biosynthesis|nr:glycosyltransferase family 4 protein [Anaerolineae bacterium]MDX9833260.1 glycosyltransferase family 4 protein [Anaerolineae bacterium]